MGIEKIRKTREFNEIYNSAKKVYTKYAIIFIRENKENKKKFGFVASKKTGNAVQRNRIKRLFREFARLNESKFKENTDYIFVGKAILKDNIANLSYIDFENDLKKGIKGIRWLKNFYYI